MSASPQVPVVNAGAMYINGLGLSPRSNNPELHFNVGYGAARNSSNTNDIILRENLVVKMNSRGALGLDVGVVEANIVYAVYVIGSSVAMYGNGQDSTPYPTSAIVSKDFQRPVMPFGYDMYRRIGTITTNSSAEITPFIQTGNSTIRTITYGDQLAVLTLGSATDFTSVYLGFVVPEIATMVFFRATYATTDTFDSFSLQPGSALDDGAYYSGSAAVNGEPFVASCYCPCDAEPSINYQVDGGPATNFLSLTVTGFEDLL